MTAHGADKKSGGIQSVGIQSLARASGLLQEIARHRGGIGLAQLSKTLGLHTSTAFHLVKTLVALGYVRQDEDTKAYRLGPLIFTLASAAFDEVEMSRIASPWLDELALRTGETSHLAIRSGDQIIVIARTDGTGAFRMAERTGGTRPAHATAIGKALLAGMGASSVEAFLAGRELRALTPRTITDAARLRQEIETVRRTGIAYDDGEYHPEVRCIAVQVKNFTGNTVAAVGISTAIWRSSLNDLAEKAVVLREIASKLSASLGHAEVEETVAAAKRA